MSAHSEPDHRISGSNDQHGQHAATTSTSQNKNDSGGVSKIVERRSYLSLRLSTSVGENECDSMRGSPGSSLLLLPTDGTIRCATEKHTELRFTGDIADTLLRGAELVGQSDVQMEWEVNVQDRN